MNTSTRDLGWGSALAPLGSEEHAKRWRLDMQAAIDDADQCPDTLAALKELGEFCRAWTVLKAKNGKPFATFDQFCEEERPYGLGTSAAHVRDVLALKEGKKAVELATVAPDRRAEREHGPDGTFQTGHRVPNGDATAEAKAERRHRAILRAPEPIQDLYKRDLIGIAEAAKLGPKKPTPDEAARAVEIVDAVLHLVPGEVPKAETKKIQKRVNAQVRAMLGTTPDPVERISRMIAKLADDDRKRLRDAIRPAVVVDPVRRVARLVRKMTADERARLAVALRPLLESP